MREGADKGDTQREIRRENEHLKDSSTTTKNRRGKNVSLIYVHYARNRVDGFSGLGVHDCFAFYVVTLRLQLVYTFVYFCFILFF